MNAFALLLLPPLLSAGLAVAVKPYRRVVGWANVLMALVSLGGAVVLWRHVLVEDVWRSGPREFLRADALSVLVAVCVAVGSALAAWFGPGLHGNDAYDASQARRFRMFGNLFTFTMLLAVTVNNVGFMWIAIEATTIVVVTIVGCVLGYEVIRRVAVLRPLFGLLRCRKANGF